MLKALKGAFGFLSILPVGMPDSLDDVARNMYLFPVVGAGIGLIAGLSFHLFYQLFPLSVSAALGYFVLLSLTGLHHLDGLLDFGDALIFRGPAEERIKVMHDAATGVGGFASGIFVIVIGILSTTEFVSSGGGAIMFFVVSEALAKLALVFSAAFGTAAFKGMGSIFVRRVGQKKRQVLISLFLTGLIVWPFFGALAVILLALALFSALFFVWASNRLINGMSGDVFGAVNEVTRVLAMLVMLWML